MLIAVISDTHDRFPWTLPERLRDADEIWHLGDVCDPVTLVEFEQLEIPLHIVHGNCDSFSGWPMKLEFERVGRRFHLVHIPPSVAPENTDVILHGHTHVPRDEMFDGARWLNPGCITRPNRGAPASFAWLTLTPDGAMTWELERV